MDNWGGNTVTRITHGGAGKQQQTVMLTIIPTVSGGLNAISYQQVMKNKKQRSKNMY